eukprot:3950455-Prymnesium_polylepis.1
MVVQFRSLCDRMMVFAQNKDGKDADLALRVWTTGFNRNALVQGLNGNDWCYYRGATTSDNGKCWVNGDNRRARWDGFPDAPVVIVAARQPGRGGDDDDFVFQLSSRFVPNEGDNRAFDGYVGELIVWNRVLTPMEAHRANMYLQCKWMLSGEEAQLKATAWEQMMQGEIALDAAVPNGAMPSQYLIE